MATKLEKSKKFDGIAKWIMILMGLAFMAVGAGMTIESTMLYFRVRPCEATIIKSQLHSEYSTGENPGYVYRPDITFTYEVDGITHSTGTYTWFPVSSNIRARHAAVVRRYPVGSQHNAWYDPKIPENAYLVRRHSWIGPIFFLAGSFFAIVMPIAIRRQKLKSASA
jgi:hypothetical protein